MLDDLKSGNNTFNVYSNNYKKKNLKTSESVKSRNNNLSNIHSKQTKNRSQNEISNSGLTYRSIDDKQKNNKNFIVHKLILPNNQKSNKNKINPNLFENKYNKNYKKLYNNWTENFLSNNDNELLFANYTTYNPNLNDQLHNKLINKK